MPLSNFCKTRLELRPNIPPHSPTKGETKLPPWCTRRTSGETYSQEKENNNNPRSISSPPLPHCRYPLSLSRGPDQETSQLNSTQRHKQQQFPPWHTARTLGLPPKKRKNKKLRCEPRFPNHNFHIIDIPSLFPRPRTTRTRTSTHL